MDHDVRGICGIISSHGPTIMSRAAKAPGVGLLEQEEDGDKAPCIAKELAILALPPFLAIIQL